MMSMGSCAMVTGEDGSKRFDHRAFIEKRGGAILKFANGQTIFAQGDRADSLFYIVGGTVKATFVSEFGKEAVIGILHPDDFFGESCLYEPFLRKMTIISTNDCDIARLERSAIVQALAEDQVFAGLFLRFLVSRNQTLQADLIDHLFNSSEKRLARILLTLANSGLSTQSNVITMAINQEMLASMVGTTRSRINQFMNKFRKLGYIDYNGHIKVNNSLLNLILNEQQNDNGQPQTGES
jgi:CRP-like cAMP-binding protein